MAEFVETASVDFKIEKAKISSETESGRKLTEKLEKSKIDFDLQKTGMEEMPEIFLLNKNNFQGEKCVRIYRGIGLPETVLTQIPYLARTEESKFAIKGDEETVIKIDDLAENPTYEKLIDCINVNLKQNSRDEIRFRDNLKKIEENILKGEGDTNVARELKFNTFGHLGGIVAESGISPYLSASFDVKESLDYTKKGGVLMVIDIPISKLSFINTETHGELFINGKLDNKYIRAVIPKVKEISDESKDILDKIESIIDGISGNIYKKEELSMVVSEHFNKMVEKEKEQNKVDIELIKNKRAGKLIESFSYWIPNLKELIADNQDTYLDFYTGTKSTIYDFFKNELEKIGENLDDFEYKEETFNKKVEKYSRNKVDDDMLHSLRSLVSKRKEYYEDLAERRKKVVRS